MTQDEIIEMARQAGLVPILENVRLGDKGILATDCIEAFAKLVAAKAIAKDREEFNIDELCARQNKIGYKQGYRAGQLAEREACADICDRFQARDVGMQPAECAGAIRSRNQP